VQKILADPDYRFEVAVVAPEVALDETCEDFYKKLLSSLRSLTLQDQCDAPLDHLEISV
jgi:hypothetical protein